MVSLMILMAARSHTRREYFSYFADNRFSNIHVWCEWEKVNNRLGSLKYYLYDYRFSSFNIYICSNLKITANADVITPSGSKESNANVIHYIIILKCKPI